MLYKNPTVTIVAIISLALAIGANTTIFTLVNAILLRPLPVKEPSRLVNVHAINHDGSSFHTFSYLDYLDYKERGEAFEDMLAYTVDTYSLNAGGPQSERIFALVATGNFFRLLGVQPALGRFFTPEEDRAPSGEAVVVLSNGYWHRRFGGDPSVVGRQLVLNGDSYAVLGIAPPNFTGPRVAFAPDVYLPLWSQGRTRRGSEWLNNRDGGSLEIIGRLKPDATIQQAQAHLNAVSRQIIEQSSDAHRVKGVDVRSINTGLGQFEAPVIGFMSVLMAVVGLVLLIACANVAGMLLTRATTRRREMAIRLAVGAPRSRIIRQLLTESVLLFLLGGVAGLFLTAWLSNLLLAFKPPTPFTIELDLGMDARVLAFTLLISLLTGIIFGLAPALQASKSDMLPALKDETPGGGYRRSRLLNTFVVGQIAISLVLLICTGLFLRSLQHARTLDPGFDPENVLVAGFDLGIQGYEKAKGRRFYQELTQRVAAMPGVQSVSLANAIPLNGGNTVTGINVEGHEPSQGQTAFETDFNTVTPGYFATLRIPLLRGRDFSDGDREGVPRVALINEAMWRRFWPDQDPLGKRFYLGSFAEGELVEIVGVVKDGKYRTLGESSLPYFYVPFDQHYNPQMTIHVRTATAGSSANALAAVRQAVAETDGSVPLLDVMPMTQAIGVSLLPIRMAATVAGCFGFIGLLLAAVGIFGVVSFSVAQRTREIGIRIALGAGKSDVLKLMVWQGMSLALFGVCVGLLLAVALTRLLASLLYGVSTTDTVTFVAVSLLLAAVALLASFIPARRAMKVDPMVALRYE
jgi:predicted permease